MLATSKRTGSRRRGSVIVTYDDVRFGYVYNRHGRPEMLTIQQAGGAFAVGPLGDALFDIASRAAEAVDDGPIRWRIDEVVGGYEVVCLGIARAA